MLEVIGPLPRLNARASALWKLAPPIELGRAPARETFSISCVEFGDGGERLR